MNGMISRGGKEGVQQQRKQNHLRSEIFTKEQNARLDKLEEEKIQCGEEVINKEQLDFGLGLKPQKTNSRSNNNQATKRKSIYTITIVMEFENDKPGGTQCIFIWGDE